MSERGTSLLLETVFKLGGVGSGVGLAFRRYLLAGFLGSFFFFATMILLFAWFALSLSHNS